MEAYAEYMTDEDPKAGGSKDQALKYILRAPYHQDLPSDQTFLSQHHGSIFHDSRRVSLKSGPIAYREQRTRSSAGDYASIFYDGIINA